MVANDECEVALGGPSSTISSPLIVGEKIYTVASPVTLICLDKETGWIIWRAEPEGKFFRETYSDLVLAGDYLFLFEGNYEPKWWDGKCLVLKAGRTYERVGVNRLERVVSNTPLFEGRRLYMRTLNSLFCIEELDNEENR